MTKRKRTETWRFQSLNLISTARDLGDDDKHYGTKECHRFN